MKNFLFVPIQMFDYNQHIFLYTNNAIKLIKVSTMEDLPKTLVALCEHYNTNEIHFKGIKVYNEEVAKMVLTANNNTALKINFIYED